MICKFCGIETEYCKLVDGTASCDVCYMENRYIIEDCYKKYRENKDKNMDKEKKKKKILPESNKFDPVTRPMHYNSTNIQTRKVNRDITSDKPGDEAGPVFNIVKYISRYNKKNGIQDVEKVIFYSLELLSILMDKEGLSKNEISEYIFRLLDKYKAQFTPDRLSIFKD